MAPCLIHRHVPRAFCEAGSGNDVPACHLSGWKKPLSSALVKHSYFGKRGVGWNGLRCCDRAACPSRTSLPGLGPLHVARMGKRCELWKEMQANAGPGKGQWDSTETSEECHNHCLLVYQQHKRLPEGSSTPIPSLPCSSPFRPVLQETSSLDKLPGSQIRPAFVLEKLASPANSPLSQHQLRGLA